MFRGVRNPVAPIALTVGSRVKFDGDPEWWTVKAVTDHFVALARPVANDDRRKHLDDQWESEHPNDLEGDVFYTVIDWEGGQRGPCNLIGQSWGDGTYTEAECAAMLAEFEAGDLEVSHRNNVAIDIAEVTA